MRGDQKLYACDFASGTNGWSFYNGQWAVEQGALTQSAMGENVRAFAGEKKWDDYVYTLKARKLGGDEGFLISFLVQDEEAKSWWNIGGWGNTRHALEMDGIVANGVEGSIETGRWYDVRVEVSKSAVKCYLDGRLIHEATYPKTKALYATASHDNKAREVILKVVNASRQPQTTELVVRGADLKKQGSLTTLTSGNPADENTLDQPTKVAPVTTTLNECGPFFTHTFPPNSVSVLRLKQR